MAGEPNTAEKQNEIRRAMKQKQKHYRKKQNNSGQKEDHRIARHIQGKFAGETAQQIADFFAKQPHYPLTTDFFRNILRNGGVIFIEGKYGDVSITSDSISSGVDIWSVEVHTSGGYGVKFKTIGGRDGKPRKVIVS